MPSSNVERLIKLIEQGDFEDRYARLVPENIERDDFIRLMNVAANQEFVALLLLDKIDEKKAQGVTSKDLYNLMRYTLDQEEASIAVVIALARLDHGLSLAHQRRFSFLSRKKEVVKEEVQTTPEIQDNLRKIAAVVLSSKTLPLDDFERFCEKFSVKIYSKEVFFEITKRGDNGQVAALDNIFANQYFDPKIFSDDEVKKLFDDVEKLCDANPQMQRGKIYEKYFYVLPQAMRILEPAQFLSMVREIDLEDFLKNESLKRKLNAMLKIDSQRQQVSETICAIIENKYRGRLFADDAKEFEEQVELVEREFPKSDLFKNFGAAGNLILANSSKQSHKKFAQEKLRALGAVKILPQLFAENQFAYAAIRTEQQEDARYGRTEVLSNGTVIREILPEERHVLFEVNPQDQTPKPDEAEEKTQQVFERLRRENLLVLDWQDQNLRGFLRREKATATSSQFLDSVLSLMKYPRELAKPLDESLRIFPQASSVGDLYFAYETMPHLFNAETLKKLRDNGFPLEQLMFEKLGADIDFAAIFDEMKFVREAVEEFENRDIYNTIYLPGEENHELHQEISEQFIDVIKKLAQSRQLTLQHLEKWYDVNSNVAFFSKEGREILLLFAQNKSQELGEILGKKFNQRLKGTGLMSLSQMSFDEEMLFLRDDEMDRAFIEQIEDVRALVFLYSQCRPQIQQFIKLKVEDYCKKFSPALLLMTEGLPQESDALVKNLYAMRDVIKTYMTDPYLFDLRKDYEKNPDFLRFLIETNADEVEMASFAVANDPIKIKVGREEVTLRNGNHIRIVFKYFPQLLRGAIGQVAHNQRFTRNVAQNLESDEALYVDKASYDLFYAMNAANGVEVINTAHLVPIQQLFKIQKKFKLAARVSNPTVMASPIMKAITAIDVNDHDSFKTFYRSLPSDELLKLGLYAPEEKDYKAAESFFTQNMEGFKKRQDELQRKIDEIKKINSQGYAIDPTYLALKGEKTILDNIIDEVEGMKNSPDKEKSLLAAVHHFREFSDQAKAKFSRASSAEFERLVKNAHLIDQTREVPANWAKFCENIKGIIELGECSANEAEFISGMSTVFNIITQPNCGTNLRVSLEKILIGWRYSEPNQRAFAMSLVEMAWPYLNSGRDIIGTSNNIAEIFEGTSEKSGHEIYIPLNAFMHNIGKNSGVQDESRSFAEIGRAVLKEIGKHDSKAKEISKKGKEIILKSAARLTGTIQQHNTSIA